MSKLRRAPSRTLALAVLIVLALAVSACTGSATTNGPDASSPDAEATTEPTATIVETPTPVVTPAADTSGSDDTGEGDRGPIAIPITTPTPPPTPGPVGIAEQTAGCRGDADLFATFDIVNVEADDPDGGLVVHTDPGVDTPEVGVIPPYARGVQFNGQCETLPSGAEWWQIWTPEAFGWVNAAYLGQRMPAIDELAVTPCSDVDGTDLDPATAGGSSANYGTTFAVNDIRVESTEECDRVVIEFASDWDFGTTPRPMDAFPVDAVTAIFQQEQELQLVLNPVFATAFDSVPPVEAWRDELTGEQNVALVLDRDGHSEIHIGWGTGIATVMFAPSPARVIVDIVQAPSPPGTIRGPIVAGPGSGPILFAPITETPHIGVEGPIMLRGWSRGFEASSYFDVGLWSGTIDGHPGTWDGVLFGQTLLRSAPRPDLTFDPPLPSFGDGADVFPFSTSGYFEYEVDGFEIGPWQLAVVSSGGISCTPAVGQQFWVADDSEMFTGLIAAGIELVAGEAFGLRPDFNLSGEARSLTTIDVGGVEYRSEVSCD